MKKFVTLLSFISAALTMNAQQYSSIAGQDAAFNAKYKLTVTMDEAKHTLKFETDAPLKKVIFSTYTKEQLAVRIGTDYIKNFSPAGHSFSYNLNTAANKDKHAYWLKFYTTDGLFEEYYFQRKADASSNTEADSPGEETKNADGATVIKTNIKCAAGKTKVIDALKQLEGVFDVKIDITTGKLTIKYSSDGTPYTTILSTINENGFDANGQKSTDASANPCVKKASN